MKRTLLLLTSCLLLWGCTSRPSLYTVMDEARVMMRYQPADAYTFLLKNQSQADEAGDEERMRFYLLLAEVAWEADADMPSDTLCREVVDYFDRGGSPNMQMKANYVMGLKYLSMQSAPEAMQCFYIAADKPQDADGGTPDYETLMAIYQQMASILHYQDMFSTEITANDRYSEAADHLGYTYESIMGQERNIEANIMMGDTVAALAAIARVDSMYRDAGYAEQATATYIHAIPIYIARGQMDDARRLMQQVRSLSSVFAADGTLLPGHEMYYQTLARYHLALGQTDSATIYYTRLLDAGYKLNACRGLLAIYRDRHPDDYISRLFQTYVEASDQQNLRKGSQQVHRLSYMYNYHRFQRIAEEKAAEAERSRIVTTVTIIVVLLLVAGGVWLIVQGNRRQRRQRVALQQILDEQYRRSEQYAADKQREIAQAEATLKAMNEENRQLKDMVAEQRAVVSEQQRTVDEQKHMLDIHMRQVQLDRERQSVAESHFFLSGIYSILRQHLDQGTIPTDTQWQTLEERILQVYPAFHDQLYSLHQFTPTEYRICLLTKIKVSPSNMAQLMATSKSSISQNRSRMYRKVFHATGTPEQWDDFILSLE